MAVLALTLTSVGCGSKQTSGDGPLAWQARRVLIPHNLPQDRIVAGRVRNTSGHSVHLDASRIKVRDATGRSLVATGRFTNTYAHGLFGAFQRPNPVPPAELLRLGIVLDLAPGATAPLYAAWRLPRGAREPVRVDYGPGSLPVPPAATRAP